MKDRPKLKKANEVIAALRLRYPRDAYAFLEQVSNATGFKARRWSDALVMSLWPSRGLEVIGIEVKVSRSDWLAELNNPAKADEIAKYCDAWYLAVGDEEIVQTGELPMGWGLLVPMADGKMRCKTEPIRNHDVRLDRPFIAAVLRRAQEQIVPEAELQAKYREGQAEAEKRLKDYVPSEYKFAKQYHDELKNKVAEFELASGVSIQHAWDGGKLGEAVRLVRNGAYLREKEQLRGLHETALKCVKRIETELAATELLDKEAHGT